MFIRICHIITTIATNKSVPSVTNKKCLEYCEQQNEVDEILGLNMNLVDYNVDISSQLNSYSNEYFNESDIF